MPDRPTVTVQRVARGGASFDVTDHRSSARVRIEGGDRDLVAAMVTTIQDAAALRTLLSDAITLVCGRNAYVQRHARWAATGATDAADWLADYDQAVIDFLNTAGVLGVRQDPDRLLRVVMTEAAERRDARRAELRGVALADMAAEEAAAVLDAALDHLDDARDRRDQEAPEWTL